MPVSHKQNTLKTPKNNSKLMNYTNSSLTLKSDVVNFSFKGRNSADLDPENVFNLLMMFDKNSRKSLFSATYNEVEDYNRILGDAAPLVFIFATLKQDRHQQNVIHKLFIDTLKAYADEVRRFHCDTINQTKSVQDIYDKCSFDFQSAKKMRAISLALGEKSPEAIEKALLTQDECGQTPLHLANLCNVNPYVQLYGTSSFSSVVVNTKNMNSKDENNILNNAYADLIYCARRLIGR